MQKSKIKDDLQEKISELKSQVADLDNKWKRALADYQNLERDSQNQKRSWIEFASCDLLLKILPILANLKRSADHLKDKGLELTIAQMEKILKDEGVEEIQITPGKTLFDAKLMECIDVLPGEENKIIKVTENGYLVKGKLLKPALVIVGKTKNN